MLEYPECAVISRQITEALAGRTIVAVEVEQSPHKFAFFLGDKAEYPRLLAGARVKSGLARGGHVAVETDKGALAFSDGAYPRYAAPGEKPPAKRQFLLAFDDGAHVSVSIQMYGFIGFTAPDGDAGAYFRAAAEKPDPLGEDFTYEYFKGLYPDNGKKLPLKALLATEQRVPGLGNGVLQDILWNAGMDPRRDARSLTDAELRALYGSVRATLREMRELGGRSTERDFFGRPGGYPCRLCKDTLGSPCPRCGAPIEKAAYMGGAVYFCAGCQGRG
ncbi:MAG TPA: endonuclease VIII [Clostridia bacterium]|nr:MAG: Formamidopyrimidine-DNA glycosylase [Firmicutes bacterium ADurb.Bin248]HOS18361.1 endonuclease VIII [Clostridia bacterium]HPK15213.1 endonuclease VIII [Clostridia bacterium]